MLIIGPITFLGILQGESVWTSILNFSTINYWLNHRGAWFIVMLIPLYAITPLHYLECNRTNAATTYNMAVVLSLVVMACIKVDFSCVFAAKLFDNIQFVTFRLPAFFIGYMLAPYAKEDKSVSLVWMLIIPLIVVAAMRFLHFGYWPGFLVLPLVVFSCCILRHTGCVARKTLSFFGKISLESYLFNTTIGSVLIFLFPKIHESYLNNNGYLHYVAILIIGTLLAYSVNKICERIILKNRIFVTIKYFFEVYPPKRMWRKLWIGLSSLPMLPQHRARILKLGGVNIKGRSMIYGGVGIDTVYPDKIYIGKGVRITAGTKILTHYLDPTQPGVHFRKGEVHIENDVFIGVIVCICSSVTIGEGAIVGAGSVVTKNIPPYQVWAGNPARYIKDRAR